MEKYCQTPSGLSFGAQDWLNFLYMTISCEITFELSAHVSKIFIGNTFFFLCSVARGMCLNKFCFFCKLQNLFMENVTLKFWKNFFLNRIRIFPFFIIRVISIWGFFKFVMELLKFYAMSCKWFTTATSIKPFSIKTCCKDSQQKIRYFTGSIFLPNII